MKKEKKEKIETQDSESKNETKKTMTMILIGMFSFMITVVVAGTFLVISLKSPEKSNDAHKEALMHGEAKEEIGPLVSVGSDIIVNIPSETGEQHYLKVNITLEIKPEAGAKKGGEEGGGPAVEEVTKRIPQIRDTVISILRLKTTEKIDEKEGKDLIRSEIINNVNKFLISGRIKNVYFQDFVIQ